MSIIPKKLQLAGLDIQVVFDNTLFEKSKLIGEARYSSQTIALDTTMFTNIQSHEHNYCHELIHWLFFMSGRQSLRVDESLVEVMSGLLHQALTSPRNYFTEAEIQGGRK